MRSTGCHGNAGTHVVAIRKSFLQGAAHVVMLNGHEERIDDDAHRDKHIDESIEDEDTDILLQLPYPGDALPPQHVIYAVVGRLFLPATFPLLARRAAVLCQRAKIDRSVKIDRRTKDEAS